ncbi:MAG: helix-turn-helix domain-containing protein [Pseudonocardiaceae bacterium]|nr:helix-turn-helix domain-containing protein [Pseudonocardiaceae bacterium]
MITVTADVRTALARHDITTAYRLLIESGIPQREIAQATGQSQSEVSDIRAGRRVLGYDVLVRIADGLGVERGLMGLGWGPTGRYDEARARAAGELGAEEVTEAVKRRNFVMAVAGAVTWGHPVLRELLDAPSNAPAPVLPTKLAASDVTALRDLTATMRTLARQYGGQADAIGTTARNYTRLLTVPGTDAVKAQLGSALAELHTVAGWAYHDVMAPDAARAHFGRAMELGRCARDSYATCYAVRHAGIAMNEADAPNDGLKLFQLAQAKLTDLPTGDPTVTVLGAWLHMESAISFARMNRSTDARYELTRARDGWEPPDVFDAADADYATAWVHNQLGNLDTAAAFAKSSLGTWSKTDDRRDAVEARILLATIHAQTGEPDTAKLADKAIAEVSELPSARPRTMLAPLGQALAQRGQHDLAHRARAVAQA